MADRCCPRCRGWLAPGEDQYGKYVYCRNCGWYNDLALNGQQPFGLKKYQPYGPDGLRLPQGVEE